MTDGQAFDMIIEERMDADMARQAESLGYEEYIARMHGEYIAQLEREYIAEVEMKKGGLTHEPIP
jgi:hypothetical protein